MIRASLSSSENHPVADLEIKRVNRCIVTRSQLVLTTRGVHGASLFNNIPFWNRVQMNIVGGLSILRNELERLEDRDDYYFLMNVWAKGYHHWLAEVAPKFVHFEGELRKGRILMPKYRPRFISEFLDAFGFENIVEIEENAYASRLNVVTNPNSGHFNPDHIILLRDFVLERLEIPAQEPTQKIYVTRRNARARKILNEMEVVEVLARHGFECVDLENTSFRSQAELFSECSHLISIHGAALTNMIFMPQKGKVAELYPKFRRRERELNACYKRLCTALEHDHEFLFCDRRQVGRKADFHLDDITVDLNELERLLESRALI